MHELARCVVTAGDRTLDGYVVAFADGTMTVGTEHGTETGIQVGAVEVLVLDPVRGRVLYSGWVDKVRATTVDIGELELTSMLQKREAARVNITQLCNGVAHAPDEDERPITFIVLDIGAHGMRVATTAGLAVGDVITFEFPAGARRVALDAEVVRAQPTQGRSPQYGCRFVDLRERDSDILFRYVLRV